MRRFLLFCTAIGGGMSLAASASIAQSVPAPAVASPPMVSPMVAQGNFFDRFFKAYLDGFGPQAPADPSAVSTATPRRIPAAPLESPPFPSADWTYGGTPVIGGTDGTVGTGPLMTALAGTGLGNVLNNARISVYGWVDPGFNVSTSYKKAGNAPAAYYYAPNTVQLDQFALYLERLPDENQRDHIDWGFRVTGLYGTDYRYTTAYGYNSDPYIKRNHQYGVDIPMAYVDVYVPFIGYGTNFRLGRYISLPDIEAQLAPDNYFFSHSLLYTVDPYTQTGLTGSTMLDEKGQWIIQYGISDGNDISPTSKGAQPTGTACLRYTTPSTNDNLYGCANSSNDGKFAYNNLQSYYLTWYHRFSDPHWHMASEVWYMYEKKTPAAGTVTGYGVNGPYGAACNTGTRCFSDEQAFTNYVMYEFSPHDSVGLRNEVFNDAKGQRTGFKTLYSEHAISWNHYFSDNIYTRPELRYEHSYNAAAYNSGSSRNQFIFAADLIIKY